MTVQVAEVTPTPPPTPSAGAAAPDNLGADDAELKAAEAELAAAGQSLDTVAEPGQPGTEPPAAETVQGDSPAGADTAAGAEGQEARETIRIPKAEFDKRMAKARAATIEARELAAYWKGVAEGGGVKPGDQAPPQPEPIQDPHVEALKSIKAQRLALGKELQDGNLTTEEWLERDLVLQEQREELVSTRLLDQAVHEATPDPRRDQSVQRFTRELESTRPWLQNVPVDVWHRVDPAARLLAEANDLVIDGTPQGTINLRACSVAVLENNGLHRRFGGTDAPPPQQPTPNAAPAAQQGATPAQIKAKQLLAGRQPPAPTAAGQAVVDAGQYTEDSLTKMTEAELAALPASVLKRFGITL